MREKYPASEQMRIEVKKGKSRGKEMAPNSKNADEVFKQFIAKSPRGRYTFDSERDAPRSELCRAQEGERQKECIMVRSSLTSAAETLFIILPLLTLSLDVQSSGGRTAEGVYYDSDAQHQAVPGYAGELDSKKPHNAAIIFVSCPPTPTTSLLQLHLFTFSL
ncbi:hypothetical protein A7U60_g8863 [Sanghuangporus baumii]|uniref:Uncharacterized protein n=1 Tax=Sanghuangporus baumii TaxID=108892 RepID=A0A9Q5HQY9_SANBA|nr:hypothetical protein A7U60_g8863 [Sanghuangporus baumii]